jgi:hypothetical protein
MILYNEGNHLLTAYRDDRDRQVVAWFQKHTIH